MKKAILAIMLSVLLVNMIPAQWYERKCGVIDLDNCSDTEYECMWNRATKVVRTGAITTIIGTTSIIAGILVLNDASMDIVSTIFIGGFGTIGGIMLDCIGIPVWITGGVRRSQLRNVPGHGGQGPLSLSLSPSFQVNRLSNSHCLSMGVTLHFSL
jgi:hypothetical protein